MIFRHSDLCVELNDDWLVKAGAINFVPSSTAYNVDRKLYKACLIHIDLIAPVQRADGVPIFNKSVEEGITAEERVIRILKGYVRGDALPPIEVAMVSGQGPPFKLINGVHRLYCSLAVGFTQIPAIQGIEFGVI